MVQAIEGDTPTDAHSTNHLGGRRGLAVILAVAAVDARQGQAAAADPDAASGRTGHFQCCGS